MKNNILTFFLILVQGISFADCGNDGMVFYPQEKNISLNSLFIIQGFGFSQQTVNSFNNRIIYLENEIGEKIELELIEINKGQMYLTQAVFKPKSILKPNSKYFLSYSNQTERETFEMQIWNSKTEKREKIFWLTTDKEFVRAVDSSLKINFEKTELIQYGCGPSANAIFEIENNKGDEIWYKTELVDLNTNQITIFYLKTWKEKLNVGHDMCGGAFIFKEKTKYKVRFTPTNIDGKTIKTTDWTIFESPYKEKKHY